jgi:hypothetical protein
MKETGGICAARLFLSCHGHPSDPRETNRSVTKMNIHPSAVVKEIAPVRRYDGAIRAELTGSDTACALGITARSASPVLALCRRLIGECGCDPELVLACYRQELLCLTVRIGTAAALEVNPKGTGFIMARAVRAASPVRGGGDV